MTLHDRALVWFRRDLRDHDHAALAAALAEAREVHAVFVFDRAILDALAPGDRRVTFIHESVRALDAALRARGGALNVLHADARDGIPTLAAALRVGAVYANRDYEPAARARDAVVADRLAALGIGFRTPKDQVVFDTDELRTQAGRPFTVFTPYRRAWRAALTPAALAEHDSTGRGSHGGGLARPARMPALPTLTALGFDAAALPDAEPGMRGAARAWARFRERLPAYHEDRDAPAREGTSRLSVHLRFGTISVRALARHAHALVLSGAAPGADKWMDELAWRDFFAQLLWHFPHVVDAPFRPEYAHVAWRDDVHAFAAWCRGRTGYPLVDAGMRELVTTGWMHNRVRMVTASFLAKHLLIDWRLGERFFAQHLLDYDLASNNGGWQWAASTGCDAQPWFRIFNPVLQSERFDPDGTYIRRHVPELRRVPRDHVHAPWLMPASMQAECGVRIGRDYPTPVVEHAGARLRALAAFRAAASARSSAA